MKYALLTIGLLMILAGTRLSADGAQFGYDAAIAAVPIFFGALLAATGIAMYIYERYVEK